MNEVSVNIYVHLVESLEEGESLATGKKEKKLVVVALWLSVVKPRCWLLLQSCLQGPANNAAV